MLYKNTCPLCGLVVKKGGVGSHLKGCSKKHNISRLEASERYLLTYSKYPGKEKFLQDYEKDSLLGLSLTYEVPRSFLQNFLKQLDVRVKGISEARLQEKSKSRSIQTCLKVYGAVNCLSRGTLPFIKRNKTVQEKYGVANVFSSEEIKKKILDDAVWIEKYGCTRKEYRKRKSSEAWERKTPEEKEQWLLHSLHSEAAICKAKQNLTGHSSLEKRIWEILDNKNIEYIVNFRIRASKKNIERSYLYDIVIPDVKLAIEIQGDYWHANPTIFQATDIIKPSHVTAAEKWERDERKKQEIIKKGYSFVAIWELEMKELTNEELFERLQEEIINAGLVYENSKN